VKENKFAFRGKGFVAIWVAFYVTALLIPQLKVLRGNSDFLAQYTSATVVLSGKGQDLYDFEAQKRVQRTILDSLDSDVEFAGGLLLFSHPPFVAFLYVTVAWLSYIPAFLAWNLISGACLIAGVVKLVRFYQIKSPTDLEQIGLSCLIFMPVSAVLLQGQSTSVAFLCLVLAFVNLKRASEFWGGLWLSLALIKFQILPLLLLVLLFKKRAKALVGFLTGGLSLAAASLLTVGPAALLRYLSLLRDMPGWVDLYGVNPVGANCLRGQVYLLFYNALPEMALAVSLLLNGALIVFALFCWKGNWNSESPVFDLKFGLTIVVGLLIAPQVNFHDLSFLLFPGVILFHVADRKVGHMPIRWILFTVAFPLQILSFMALPIVPIQLNVIGLIVLSAVFFEAIRLRENTLLGGKSV